MPDKQGEEKREDKNKGAREREEKRENKKKGAGGREREEDIYIESKRIRYEIHNTAVT